MLADEMPSLVRAQCGDETSGHPEPPQPERDVRRRSSDDFSNWLAGGLDDVDERFSDDKDVSGSGVS
jgi:hypothetical protein